MQKLMCMVTLGALVSVMLHCAAAQTVHVVGDNIGGWRIPENGASDYSNWASGKTFMVGDVLEFNFTTGHDVQKVQRSSFDACDTASALGDPIMSGPANVTLGASGEHYFICTIGQHCQAGQKLAVTVSSGTSGAMPPVAGGGPSVSQTPPGNPPPESSSSAAFASLLVTLLSIAVAYFF